MTFDEAVYTIELKATRIIPTVDADTGHKYGLMQWDVRQGARDEFRKYSSVIAADMSANPDCKHRAAIREALTALYGYELAA